jgi:hypothetical protein
MSFYRRPDTKVEARALRAQLQPYEEALAERIRQDILEHDFEMLQLIEAEQECGHFDVSVRFGRREAQIVLEPRSAHPDVTEVLTQFAESLRDHVYDSHLRYEGTQTIFHGDRDATVELLNRQLRERGKPPGPPSYLAGDVFADHDAAPPQPRGR